MTEEKAGDGANSDDGDYYRKASLPKTRIR